MNQAILKVRTFRGPVEVLAEELRIIKVLEAEKREIESSRKELDADKKTFEEETDVTRASSPWKKPQVHHDSLVIPRNL